MLGTSSQGICYALVYSVRGRVAENTAMPPNPSGGCKEAAERMHGNSFFLRAIATGSDACDEI